MSKQDKSEPIIEGLTIAVVNMEEMVKFYSAVFRLSFSELEMYGAKLYASQWGELKLLFCPASVAGNTATQNRHQFDIVVPDLNQTIQLVVNSGGTLMGNISENDGIKSVGIYDPDQNSIVFKQLK